jgi:pre-mRNA-processing factor 17
MPFVAMNPSGTHFCGQSLDNTIQTYEANNRFKHHRKKVFKGHTNSGTAAQISFSPNGRFILSGDSDGKCFFWDWKSCRMFRKFKAHDKACLGCVWHPLDPSRVATCGWDGLIKLWD